MNSRPQLRSLNQFKYFVKHYLFLKHYVTSDGVVSHNVYHYQQLSIAPCQVSCYAINYF